jgi:hypothetical protein
MLVHHRIWFPSLFAASIFFAGCGAEDPSANESANGADEIATSEASLAATCAPGLLRVLSFAVDFTGEIPQKANNVRATVNNPGRTTCSRTGSVGIRDLSGNLIALEHIPARDFKSGINTQVSYAFHGRYRPPFNLNLCFGGDETCLIKRINEPIGE